ncbi:LOW QUALITY PROTEIN: tripartite motif-containing protein 75-like [Arvicanthis niloticus]|uniref:LOW QUALITY PROTEIN: tripartite motif-containing protein 75-like n=1 Tax=Arvicanthis niloticus TaxID=61156 RepID=UPI0014869F87|nr:LOW QUALITY PROTEIN: tripartite motif-containing protein 75-like [Arvicanthis niloticus]
MGRTTVQVGLIVPKGHARANLQKEAHLGPDLYSQSDDTGQVLARLQKESKCPICLEDLTGPVTIECRHNFCHSCIKNCWAREQQAMSCPVCQHQCQHRNLGSNAQLGKMTETAQLLQGMKSKRKRQESSTSCEKHNRVFTCFCENDLQLLCDQCTEPENHELHQVTSITEAASLHRKNLQGYIKFLKGHMEQVRELMNMQSRTMLALREEAEAQRVQLSFEFEQLVLFLDRERQAALSRLEDEEKKIGKTLLDNIATLEYHISMLRDLLSQLMLTRVFSEVKMLSTVSDFYRNFNSQLISPSISPVQLKREAFTFPLQYSALQKVIRRFADDVTLDLKTAHPNLLISEDRTCVTFTKERQNVPGSSSFTKRSVVLRILHFNSGRHFWEVWVGKKPECAIGICKADLAIEQRRSSNPQGCWSFICQGDNFSVSGADPESQLTAARATSIGVFLNYELGEVSFYSMPEKRHLYTFRGTFTGPVCPYFYIGPQSEPLRLFCHEF